ncbi:DUF502 domain-containing protein [candidate division KSB1 bacterium]|nr:DUF502 domain-containing protein [candidate division KSB1 bacterium]
MKQRISLGRRFRIYFFAGLLVIIPLALTVYVVWNLFIAVDGLLATPVSQAIYRALDIVPKYRTIPGLGFIALILVILTVGFIARNYVGKKLLGFGDAVLGRIPVVRHIYTTFQQISQAFLADHSETFKRAVLIEYPRKGIYSIGFVTQDTRGIVQSKLPDDVVSIFLPTTPNPTSGFLLFVPKKDIVLLNITVEEALKLVISGGAIVPSVVEKQELINGFGIAEDENFFQE